MFFLGKEFLVKYETRILKVGVMDAEQSIFDEGVTFVEIADDAAGEFVVLSQNEPTGDPKRTISTDRSQWPVLRQAIDDMVKRCK
jgi:hypothetical protein